MTSDPFLRRFEVRDDLEPSKSAIYDPALMMLVIDGKLAIEHPMFEEAGTIYTKVKQETNDDQ